MSAKPAPTFVTKAVKSWKTSLVYDWGWAPAPVRTEYADVARALGFTLREIEALVKCNDAGVPFAEIADLIEAHPVVYSSAMTPNRVAEENDFVSRCADVMSARAGVPSCKSKFTLGKSLPTFSIDYGAYEASVIFDVPPPKPSPLWTPDAPTESVTLASALGIWTPPMKKKPSLFPLWMMGS